MNKIKIFSVTALAASILFSVLSVHFALDVSIFAFIIASGFTAVSVYFLYFKTIRKIDFSSLNVSRKLLQYLPFVLFAAFIIRRAGKNGTYFWYDIITVLLWCIVFISSNIVLYFINEKRYAVYVPEWKNGKILKKKGIFKLIFEVIDWIDAILQAVFMVLLIQIFIIQLYVIPSESMVPAFLVNDRVVVLKTTAGPKFPLSEVGLPCLKKYKRGDIVVFRNPHYSMDRKSEVRTVVSQIVYMLSFTGINLNLDEKGQPKADPLVKRISGLPGEQIVMQDGTLYARTSASDEFLPIEKDTKFAAWNLNSIEPTTKQRIQYIPISDDYYELMLEIESDRRNFSIDSAVYECQNLYSRFTKASSFLPKTTDEEPEIPMFEYEFFSSYKDYASKLLQSSKGQAWFKSFMTDWIETKSFSVSALSEDIYGFANYKFNIMMKIAAGRLIARYAELTANDADFSDAELSYAAVLGQNLHFYAMILDQRNMPIFPVNSEDGNPSYIPKNCYFMMGDNRFNSLDMRHSYTSRLKPVTMYDKYSFTYYSNISPQFVDKKHILGTTLFRFWPIPRAGGIRTN